MLNIAVFVSGGGTNLQALIDAQDRGEIKNGKITFVLASNENAYALERAKKAGIESTVVNRKAYDTKADYDKAVLEALDGKNIDLIVLAGFLSILGEIWSTNIKTELSTFIRVLSHFSAVTVFTAKRFTRQFSTAV